MRVERGAELAQFREHRRAILLRNLHARDADPLAEVDEMRRGEEARSVPRGPGDRIDYRASTTLPVGPGDVDHLHPVIGIGQILLEQTARPVQPELDSEELGGEQPVDGFGVGHGE
jgi:hypothetical protein